MKILMYLARKFSFRPYERILDNAADQNADFQIEQAAVIFVHCEPQDEINSTGLETKFVKNVKWIAGKRGLKNIVLHSFTHLAESSASPKFAESFLQGAATRMRSTGFQVILTPFGWTCEWDLSVYGESIAKVYKSL